MKTWARMRYGSMRESAAKLCAIGGFERFVRPSNILILGACRSMMSYDCIRCHWIHAPNRSCNLSSCNEPTACSPNEDFVRPNQRFRMCFPGSTFQHFVAQSQIHPRKVLRKIALKGWLGLTKSSNDDVGRTNNKRNADLKKNHK
jgi:hypothetical protein